MRVGAAGIGQDFDVHQKGAHPAAGVNAVGSTGAQRRGGDVGAVTLTVVRVNRTVGIRGLRRGVKSSDPFLIVVACRVAVGFVVDIVEIVERTVFVVNAGVQHGDDNTFAVVAAGVRAGGIHVRRHCSGSFGGHAVEGDHDVLHLHNDNPREVVDVHQCTDGDLVDDHRVNGIHDLEPGAAFFTRPPMLVEHRGKSIKFCGVGSPSVVDHNSDGFPTVRTVNCGR